MEREVGWHQFLVLPSSSWAVGVQIETRDRNRDLLETGDRGSGRWRRQERRRLQGIQGGHDSRG
jgi:hypothetical protein